MQALNSKVAVMALLTDVHLIPMMMIMMTIVLNSVSLFTQAIILMVNFFLYTCRHLFLLLLGLELITHNWKHQKKKLGQHSCRTKPNKLDLIAPLPNCQLNSIHHSLNYDRKQSCADSSAGINHTSHKKHHDSWNLNLSIGNRRYTAKMKKGERSGE